MMFEYLPFDELPRLAWCAELVGGSNTVRLMHGRWVETGPGYFVDGAWDGAFEDKRFDRAITFTGTGGRICDRGVMFSSPTHNLEGLFSIRTRTGLLISNSLVFLFTRAGESLDISHPNYFFDVLNHYRTGLRFKKKTLRTASGLRVHCHVCANLLVLPDMRIERMDKDFGDVPTSYTEYMGFLDQSVGKVIDNARHPARVKKYRPLTAISRGYDSTATSALAARNGCHYAVSFVNGGDRAGKLVTDDGSEIASCLGLEVSLYDRRDGRDLQHPGPAELFPNPFLNSERSTQLIESELVGALLLSGRHGEHFWGTDPVRALPWLQEPTTLGMSGASSTEMRLRIGYLHYPAPYTLGVYAPALFEITCSAEMDPWRIGGVYDRPIPRRLLETAGVPRHYFGQEKVGGVGNLAIDREFNDTWEQVFQAFYFNKVPAEIRSGLVDSQIGPVPYFFKGKMGPRESWLRTRPVLRHILPHLPGDRRHHRWRSRYLYVFHWGFEHIAGRYTIVNSDQHLARANAM